jgi:hypothetical protein
MMSSTGPAARKQGVYKPTIKDRKYKSRKIVVILESTHGRVTALYALRGFLLP